MTISDKKHKFSVKDGMYIQGDLTESIKNNKQKVLIIFPGLTATPIQYTYVKIRDFMIPCGFDVFIMETYSSEEINGSYPRSLTEITMQRHIEDFKDTVGHFKGFYKEVYALGHSIGGRVVLFANDEDVKKQILLDVSGDFSTLEYKELSASNFRFSDSWNVEYIDWKDGIFYPVGGIHKELANEPWENIAKAVANLNVPTLFAAAGKDNYAKIYQNHINYPNKYAEVSGASHDFVEFGVMEYLKREILDFFSE